MESPEYTDRKELENWVGMVTGSPSHRDGHQSTEDTYVADVFTSRMHGKIIVIEAYMNRNLIHATQEDIKRAAEAVIYKPGDLVYYKGPHGECLAKFVKLDNSNEEFSEEGKLIIKFSFNC